MRFSPNWRRSTAAWIACGVAASLGLASPGVADVGVVHPNPQSVAPLRVGESVPSVAVRDIDGNTLDLASLSEKTGALLVFYRGGW